MKYKWIKSVVLVMVVAVLVPLSGASEVWGQPPSDEPNWLTYTNEKHDYSIHYPERWKIQHSYPAIHAPEIRRVRTYFIGPDYATIAVDVWDVPQQVDTLAWFQNTQRARLVEATIDGGVPEQGNALVNGLEAIFYVQPPGEQVPAAYRTYILYSEKAYMIRVCFI